MREPVCASGIGGPKGEHSEHLDGVTRGVVVEARMRRERRPRTATRMLANRRLHAQQIARYDLTTPADLVAWLGAVQAQDYGAAKWALGLRLSGSPTVVVLDGRVIGTWRRTLGRRGVAIELDLFEPTSRRHPAIAAAAAKYAAFLGLGVVA